MLLALGPRLCEPVSRTGWSLNGSTNTTLLWTMAKVPGSFFSESEVGPALVIQSKNFLISTPFNYGGRLDF